MSCRVYIRLLVESVKNERDEHLSNTSITRFITNYTNETRQWELDVLIDDFAEESLTEAKS